MSAREERTRLMDWLKDTAEKYNLDWNCTCGENQNIIFKIKFNGANEFDSERYYRIEVEFFTDSFNTRIYRSHRKDQSGYMISHKTWKFVQYPKERFAPLKDSQEIFEDYIIKIIEEKVKGKKMTVEEVLDLFKKKIYSKGGRIAFKSVDTIYKSKDKLIGLLDYPSVKACEIEIFRIYYRNEYCIRIKGIPHVTGIWTCILYPDSDDICKIENYIDNVVECIIEGLTECHQELHTSGATKYLTSEELIRIDHNAELLEKVMCAIKENKNNMDIKKVIFNNPATIVLWEDGTKTVVKRQKGERWDKEKGLAMAIVKKTYGNKGNYNDIFKKWCEEE